MYLRNFLATLALGAMAITAHAVQITGTLDIAGGATLNTNSLATATSVTAFTVASVTSGGVTPGSILDIHINPLDVVTMVASPWVFGGGQAALWSVGGFTFNLLTSTTNPGTSTTFLGISGTGTIVGNGYDPTSGVWAFTSQSPTATSENMQFSFSATTVAVPAVPDGGTTAALLGISLLGLGLASRKFAKRA